MSYRSIKRVLGETSLERKIRLLFGVSLLALIAASFLSVNRLTEDQFRDNTRKRAGELIELHLLRKHFENGQFSDDLAPPELQKKLYAAFIPLLTSAPVYEIDVLKFGDKYKRFLINAANIADGQETELLAGLNQMFRRDQLAHDRQYILGEPTTAAATIPVPQEAGENDLYPDRFLPDNKYAFYKPILFEPVCSHCHYITPDTDDGQNALGTNNAPTIQSNLGANSATVQTGNQDNSAAESDQASGDPRLAQAEEIGVMFVRIKLPYKLAKSAINRSRAILIAVAIVTAFLSMLALYWIVRYVIVKPVKHLRDVADEVSHGNMEVRSDLATGDEFEELSRSFNRMLRHLVDSQNQLQTANEDLDRKVDEQAQLNVKLHHLNQIKSDFLTNMSHELRTPLNSIIGFSELLESGQNLNEKEQRFAGNIRKSGRLLLDLINDILDLAKLEAGKMELNPSVFSIQAVVSELCDMVRATTDDKNIQLQTEIPPDLPVVIQDQVKIRQILTNLLSNAIKFTPEGGRIRVRVSRDDNQRLVLEVQDTGVGIPEADQQIIFEKFRQGSTAIGANSLTRETTGTGLGLSICRELCILLGGTIELESEVGKGSTFTVRLPWSAQARAKPTADTSSSIDELTKLQRVDFARAGQSPRPPEDWVMRDTPTSPITSSANE